MKIFLTLDQDTASSIADYFNAQQVTDPSIADISIVFLNNLTGEDPLQYVRNPLTSGIVAGNPVPESLRIAEAAYKAGIPPANILFTPTEEVTIEDVQYLYEKLIRNVPEKIAPVTMLIEQKAPVRGHVVKVPKLIGVVSFKGGVGKTTFATCLVDHYNSISEAAILLDLCEPQNGVYHLCNTNCAHSQEGIDTIDDLTASYRRVVVDVPLLFSDYGIFDAILLVVDSDVVQCIEPSSMQDLPFTAVVYNRKHAEVPVELVTSYITGVPVVTVAEDYTGCMAALAAGVPAINKSEIVGEAVGRLSSIIDSKGVKP